MTLWTDWLKKGYAPNSVINNTQTTSWQEFVTGDFAFAENGTWRLANAEKAGFEYGIIPVPGKSGAPAPAPTGGEFVSIPVQKDTARYAVSQKLVTCLTSGDNSLTTTTTLSYIAPTEQVQARQTAENPGVPGHELAHYQHGNDSGWDNATTFDPERVVETADLAAFLVLQMRELARLAGELAMPEDTARWSREADRMREALLGKLWSGDRFVARGVRSEETWSTSSLLDLMPIVLGEELPAPVSATLAARIEKHLTEYGLATEVPTSEHYQEDGYWRGPIWAPATVLVEDGLRRAGYAELADEISARFRVLCEKSGFAENFDARSGAGLRDRAYTWTASAYLILAAAHERREAAVTASA